MKLTLESTNEITTFRCGDAEVPARLWRGTNADGTEVVAMIVAVSPQTHEHERLVAFERELVELRQWPTFSGISPRFIL